MKFNELIKNSQLLSNLESNGFVTPTEIQEKVITLIEDGYDVLGQSETGSGKTLAFSLPILDRIEGNRVLQTIILSPTRELAIQIERDIEKVSTNLNIHSTCVYGSSSIEAQIKEIKRGIEIIVGTPGRVMDLIKRKVLKLSEIRFFVLDEADEMLSMGFQEELEFIFKNVNNDRQVMLFSATMPKEILRIAENYLSHEYKMISTTSKEQVPVNIKEEYYVVDKGTRVEILCRILDYYNPNKCIIFCNTKRTVDELIEKLSKKHYKADCIHGDIMQGQRIATLDRFKYGSFTYLIATDVAARGIHVDDIDIVVNYNYPESDEAYIHRIGRTGRVNKKGLSVSLVSGAEERLINNLARKHKLEITKMNVPSKEDILKNGVSNIINIINSTTKEDNNIFNEYIDSLTSIEKNNLLNMLLNERLTKSIGSDFSINLNDTKKRKDKVRSSNNSTRLFLTIGKLDKADKKSLLDFLEKKTNTKVGTFSGIEVLSKFTFVNVKNEHVDKVIKLVNNSEFNGRKIKIEIAKN